MNAERDRDRQLEQLLKHELGAATAAPASAACLDAETVATWMDGGLSPQVIAMAEAHASSCERCQALLATVARTTPAAAAVDAKGARLWRWWFAPLAASAAAATLWIIVPREPTRIPESAPKQVAEAQIPEASRDMAAPAPAASAPASPAPAAPTVARETVRERATAPAPAGTAPETARKTEAPMRADNTAEGRVGAAAPAPAPPAMAQLRRQQPVIEVVSPDVTRRWRAGAGGTIEYSTDAAATWLPASSPAGAEITAGSSPSATVCWLVGRGGLVLASSDGRTFMRMPFPEAADLTSVVATSASTATVGTTDGSTFATDNGGRTWRRQ